MSGKFAGQTVWITGASSGVGEGLAYAFHRAGARLVLSARRVAELERVRAACNSGRDVDLVPFDMADPDAIDAAASEVLARYPGVDVLVNNAGISQRALAVDTDPAVDRRIMEVDFFGPVALTRAVLPRMIAQQRGHLVVTSSVAGKHGVPMRSAYCAAKHALHGYFDTLRIEVLQHHIQVTLLVIAGVQSDVAAHALMGDGTEFGRDDWGGESGLTSRDCAEQVLAGLQSGAEELIIGIEPALQSLKLKAEDPAAFTQRMSGMLQWMIRQR